jgi:hypothetical protein
MTSGSSTNTHVGTYGSPTEMERGFCNTESGTDQLADRFEHSQCSHEKVIPKKRRLDELKVNSFLDSQASMSGSDHDEDEDEDEDDGVDMDWIAPEDNSSSGTFISEAVKAFRAKVVQNFAKKQNAERRMEEHKKERMYETVCAAGHKASVHKYCMKESILKSHTEFFLEKLDKRNCEGLTSKFKVEILLGDPGGYVHLQQYPGCNKDINCYCRAQTIVDRKSGNLFGFDLHHAGINKCITSRVVTDVRPGFTCPRVTIENFLVGTYDVAVVMLSFLRHVYLSNEHKTILVYNVVTNNPTYTKQLEAEILKCIGFRGVGKRKSELHFCPRYPRR